LRILHVFHFGGVGGVETYARLLLNELERRGDENVVIHGGPLPVDGGLERTSHHLPELDLPWFLPRSTKHRLDAILDRVEADITCIHTALLKPVAELVCSTAPALFFAHNYSGLCASGARFYGRDSSVCELSGTPDHRCVLNAYVNGCNSRRPNVLAATFTLARDTNRWMRRLPMVVCGSAYVAEAYRHAGVDAANLRVLPYGVEAAAPQRAARHHDIVLFAGRLIAHKGTDTLIRAFEQVPEPARLVVSGSGPELPRLRRLAERLGLSERIEFKGDRPAARELYPSARLVVVPSLWPEPFGLVGPEAMAHGLPVIASRVGGIPEWLADGEVGFLFEPGDVQGLADRINRLLFDRPLARRLGQQARARAGSRFTVPGYVDRFLELLREARSSGRPPLEPELVLA
jgi:glycosyltransferase involved in cell wall biosynthesis